MHLSKFNMNLLHIMSKLEFIEFKYFIYFAYFLILVKQKLDL